MYGRLQWRLVFAKQLETWWIFLDLLSLKKQRNEI